MSDKQKLMSEKEISRVFETLGIATQEQRDVYLSYPYSQQDQPDEKRFRIRLSHHTKKLD